jgi:hypothetical protein
VFDVLSELDEDVSFFPADLAGLSSLTAAERALVLDTLPRTPKARQRAEEKLRDVPPAPEVKDEAGGKKKGEWRWGQGGGSGGGSPSTLFFFVLLFRSLINLTLTTC